MALDAQRKGFETLQQDEGIEGGEGGSRIAQDYGTDAGDEGSRTGHVGKDCAVVGGVGLGYGGELVGPGLPVELAAVDNDAAEARTVAANELGGGVDYDVGAVLYGTDEVGGAEGVVDNEGHAVAVGYLGYGLEVGDVGVGVAEGLCIDGLGVGTEGCFERVEVVHLHYGVRDALRREGVGDEVERTTVEVVGGYHVVARREDVLQGIGRRRCAARHGQSGHAALEGCHTGFKNALRGIGKTAVDVACIAQAETVGGMPGIAEDVGCGLVYRYCARIGGRVGLFLSYMNLKGLKMEFFVCHSRKSFSLVCNDFRLQRYRFWNFPPSIF